MATMTSSAVAIRPAQMVGLELVAGIGAGSILNVPASPRVRRNDRTYL